MSSQSPSQQQQQQKSQNDAKQEQGQQSQNQQDTENKKEDEKPEQKAKQKKAEPEVEKQGEKYTIMKLNPNVAPVDYVVLPLYEKDGMGEIARDLNAMLNNRFGVVSSFDSSGSIGRRYARADEIGVPMCITVDHQTLNDETVTVRTRDTGQQVRVSISEL